MRASLHLFDVIGANLEVGTDFAGRELLQLTFQHPGDSVQRTHITMNVAFDCEKVECTATQEALALFKVTAKRTSKAVKE